MKLFKIIIFISGNGSTLQAIIERIAQKQWPIKIAAVISDNPNAYGLTRSEQANIPTHVFIPRLFSNKQAYHLALQNCIDTYQPDLMVLAGYMRILSPEFVHYYFSKIINIHPSLLPKFPGLHTYKQALAAGEKEHGVTVHIVTAELDAGPIIAQAKVAITANETIESLQLKVKVLEHKLYPEIIYSIAKNNLILKETAR